MVLGSILEGPWDPFCGLRRWVYAANEKVLRRTVFRCESQTVQQANRTVHPLKIDDELITVCISRHALKTSPFFLPKALSVASKLASKLMLFGTEYKS